MARLQKLPPKWAGTLLHLTSVVIFVTRYRLLMGAPADLRAAEALWIDVYWSAVSYYSWLVANSPYQKKFCFFAFLCYLLGFIVVAQHSGTLLAAGQVVESAVLGASFASVAHLFVALIEGGAIRLPIGQVVLIESGAIPQPIQQAGAGDEATINNG